MNKPRLYPLLAVPFALACLPSHALQVIEARDGVAAEAVLSAKEPTRIRIEHAPITDVFGNIHASNCSPPVAATGTAVAPAAAPAVNPTGEIDLDCDREKGEIYVRPLGTSAKPVNLFVSSANATYTLLLRRSDTPADTVVIRDRTARTDPASSRAGLFGPSSNNIRVMKALLTAMATDKPAPDMRVEHTNRTVPLWNEARFSLVATVEWRGLVGEKYLLTNVSDRAMVLAEQEFDRVNAGVVGVAIDHLNLRPGESTSVYVIRRGN